MFSQRPDVCVCVRVRMCLIINFSNHDIRYNGEAVTSLHSSRFSCNLIPNLRFCEILNFLKYVVVLFHFRKILYIVLRRQYKYNKYIS